MTRPSIGVGWHLSHLIKSSYPLDTKGCPAILDLKDVKKNIRRVSSQLEEEGYISVHPRSSEETDCSGGLSKWFQLL